MAIKSKYVRTTATTSTTDQPCVVEASDNISDKSTSPSTTTDSNASKLPRNVINLQLNTDQTDFVKTHTIRDHDIIDTKIDHDSDYSEFSQHSDSPSVQLVIGRKEIQTDDISAISENRLTLFGKKDVEISISSQSKITLTAHTSSDEQSPITDKKEQNTTPKKLRFQLDRSDIGGVPRSEKKRDDDSIVFPKLNLMHVYKDDSGNMSPMTSEPSVSQHISDTGISLTTRTTSDRDDEPIKSYGSITGGPLNVDIEEMELTDAGLSPIQADEYEMFNTAGSADDSRYTNTATSPAFDNNSFTEASTSTDRLEYKDAWNSPVDVEKNYVTAIVEEDVLHIRRGSGDVKAKIKIIEENTLRASKENLAHEKSPKHERKDTDKKEESVGT